MLRFYLTHLSLVLYLHRKGHLACTANDADDNQLFLWYGFQPGLLSEILTIANLQHATSRI